MQHAYFPLIVIPSPVVRNLLGAELGNVALLALRAILQHRRGIEVAHQQISYRKHVLAFSSRIGGQGDLILEIDLGDPRLSNRLILEADLRGADLRHRSKSSGTSGRSSRAGARR